MKFIPYTPEGTRDRLFGECRERRQVQSRLTHLFRNRGYAEIITPEVEFYDSFLTGGCAIPQESMLKIIDRSGKICVMRPECTIPIARVAATKLKDSPLPQRFYYNQNVYRSSRGNRGDDGERAQCGIELIGAKGVRADLEMLCMAVDALRSCGLEHFHIEIGHAGIYRALASEMRVDQETAEQIRTLIEGKSFAALKDFLAPYSDRPTCSALNQLAYLFGGVEVLDQAEALGSGEEGTIAYLRTLYDLLDQAGYGPYIRFDLGLVHQIDYYTGVVFRGYVEGAGTAVLSGGRYDRLLEAFGRPAQATGFAVDVDAVAACLPPVELPVVDTIVYYELSCLAQAIAAVDARPRGTCQLSPYSSLELTLEMAREKGVRQVLILDDEGERTVSV
jgi:ATP phosphoribosyltransferase regulatory subunit